MNLKRTISLSLATLMMTTALIGCSSTTAPKESAPVKTPAEYTEAYKTAIEGARTKDENDAFSIVTSPEDGLADLILQMLGLSAEDMAAYAISVSPMNTQAYGIAAILPSEGKEEAVLTGINGFVEQQKKNFDMYLMDQYDIANAAKVETLEDGTILLVMCSEQDTTFEAIKKALE